MSEVTVTPTDRNTVIALAHVIGWDTHVRFDGLVDVHTANGEWRAWNPLESPADALELEGMVPEDKRHDYHLELQAEVGITITEWLDDDCDHDYEFTAEELWLMLRRTPRQISTAVWSVMCQ